MFGVILSWLNIVLTLFGQLYATRNYTLCTICMAVGREKQDPPSPPNKLRKLSLERQRDPPPPPLLHLHIKFSLRKDAEKCRLQGYGFLVQI